VEPVGALSDAKSENYDFNVVLAASHPPEETVPQAKKKGKNAAATSVPQISAEHVVVVRVYDRSENVATAKVVTR